MAAVATTRLVLLVALAGENVAAAPAGRPVAVKLTALAKPATGLMLIASVVAAPAVTGRLVEAGARVKVAPALMTSVRLVVTVVVPDVPEMVSG